jgi:kynurenine formamidase
MIAFDLQPYRVPIGRDLDSARLATWNINGGRFMCSPYIIALRQPAFHPDTARMLLEDRDVVGIGVDTLSFDNTRSNGLDVHLIWLPEDRWGVENLKDLAKVPEAGATIVVGAPKFKGGTGGPARVLALV